MPYMLAVVMLFWGIMYIINNYIRKSIYWKICWEFCVFDTEYISQEKIEFPKKCYVPLYLKNDCDVDARHTNYQWVPTEELAPTGCIMIGNKSVEWYEVVWNCSEEYYPVIVLGYVPAVIVKMARIIPWRFIKRAYQ